MNHRISGWARLLAARGGMLGLTWLLMAPAGHGAEGTRTLTRAAEVRALSREQAELGYPVRLNAQVTFCDRDTAMLFVEDATGGVYVGTQEPVSLAVGTVVEVVGIAQGGSHLPFVARAVLFERGFAALPPARPVTVERLATGEEDCNWIEFGGVVRSVYPGNNQLQLVLAAEGKRIMVRLVDAEELLVDPVTLVDAEVRVQAVAGAPAEPSPDGVVLDLHVPHPRYLEVRVRGTPPLQTPLWTTGRLRQLSPARALVHRVRLRGQLESEPGQPVRLRDEEGFVLLSSASLAMPTEAATAAVEVVGFPGGTPEAPRLEQAVVSLLRSGGSLEPSESPDDPAGREGEYLPVLTEVAQVRGLLPEEAARGYPVRVRGVVTFSHLIGGGVWILFVQDSTAGIYVEADTVGAATCPAGKVVELEGVSDPGQYAPIIRVSRMRVVGEGPMPRARAVSVEELLTGRQDSQRVQVEGIIVRVRREPGTVYLDLLASGTVIHVMLPEGAGGAGAEGLVDALVRAEGVCGTQFNSKRQLMAVDLNVRRWEDLHVVQPAPEDPTGVPLRSIRSLSQFDLTEASRHRVRVRGTVTLEVPGLGVFLQDERDGLFIGAEAAGDIEAGDAVEASGFPRSTPSGVNLMEPRFRRLDSGGELTAAAATRERLATGELDNRLVVLEARLLERRPNRDRAVLVCQAEDWVFEALGDGEAVRTAAGEVEVGAVVRLTGVWGVHPGPLLQVPVTRLWLRSAGDIAVLRRPSWWTSRHAAALGGGLAVVVLATLAWVVLLRREVRERTLQSQRALALLEAALSQSPSGIVIADAPDVTIRWANQAARAIHGEAKLVTGMPEGRQATAWQVLRPDGGACPVEDLPLSRAVLRGEPTRNQELIIRDEAGRSRWVEASAAPIRDTSGRVVSGIVILDDITERKQVEDRLRESEDKFSRAFHLSPDSVNLNRARDGVYLDVNEGFTALTGYTAEEVVGRSSLPGDLGLWVDPADRERLMAGLKADGEVSGLEAAFRCKDGRVKTGLMSAKLISLKGEDYILSMTRDITDRKLEELEKARLQAQLLQAQKMESVGRLAGGVAHDFNNMLQVILGNVAMAMEDRIPPSELREHLTEIQTAAARSADLTRQLLAFARKQTAQPRVLDLNETVTGLLKMLERLLGEDLELLWRPGADLWPVRLDPSQVGQVLANLAVNARDALGGPGSIAIQTENVTVAPDEARHNPEWRPGDYVRLSVTDDGCGMDAETRAHLFEPFFTTKAVGKGTGLGLATVYGIVKQNEGFIRVWSELGRGTAIQIYLPRVEARLETVPTPVGAGAARGTETLLLVEDEPQVLALGRTILERHGYRVLAARLPEEALRLVEATPDPIHLVVTDLIMPGMDGRELSRRVAALKPGVRCLFMSGYTGEVIARQGVLEEGIQFLQKPFSVEDLAGRVRDVLQSSPTP